MAEDDDKPSPGGRPDAAASATTPPQPETEAAESKADDRLNEEHGSPNQRFVCDVIMSLDHMYICMMLFVES